MIRALYLIYQIFIALPIMIAVTIVVALATMIGSIFDHRFWGYWPGMIWGRLFYLLFFIPLKVELVVAQEDEVVECLVDGVDTFLAGSMATDAIRIAIDHHQAFFGDGRLHARRFSNNRNVDIGQVGAYPTEPILS